MDSRSRPSTIPSRVRSPLQFFALVFALSIPFWLLGAVTKRQLLPGLPVSALGFFCPAAAALVLVYGENGTAGVSALLKRSFDYERIRARIWYVPVILLMPAVVVSSYWLMRLTGASLPRPQFTAPAVLITSLAFFVAALGEELGWSGYVIDPMQERWGALPASILVGFVWASWHFVPFLQVHRSLAWIAGQDLFTVAARILLVWLYNNTGKSVFAAAVCHATGNVSWLLFPIYGSYYNPRVAGLIAAFTAVIVTVVWGPRTLSRQRSSRRSPPL